MTAKPTTNIYIIGAQCTGKTTLVNAVQRHFQSDPGTQHSPPQIISEIARTVLAEHSYTADDIRSSPERSLALQKLILGAQVAAERSAVKGGGWFVSDRSGIDPIVYTMRYVSQECARSSRESSEWLELRDRMAKALIVVCEAGCSWLTDDGVRLMPEDRQDWMQFHDMFGSLLGDIGLPYQLLSHSMEDLPSRVEFVVSEWKAMMSHRQGEI